MPQSSQTPSTENTFDLEHVRALFPQFEVIELIGEGGMGVVFKGRQKQLDRLIAIKLLKPSLASDPTFAERFTREARALAQLKHPNIVAVHDIGQVEGTCYFVMEYVDGMNLRQLTEATRLSPREALEFVPKICDALQYAHDSGIVHRDIKPENILLDDVVLRALRRDPDARYQHVSQMKTDIEAVSSAGGPPMSEPFSSSIDPVGSPRVSRHVIIGACFSPFGFLFLGAYMTVRTVTNGEPPELTVFELAMRLLFPVMVASPFATTVLGMIGISKIRASRGSLVGLPAAVGLSLLYPLLVFDAFLVFAVFSLASIWLTPSSDYASQIAAVQLTTLLTVPVLDAVIVYLAWRSASQPSTK